MKENKDYAGRVEAENARIAKLISGKRDTDWFFWGSLSIFMLVSASTLFWIL